MLKSSPVDGNPEKEWLEDAMQSHGLLITCSLDYICYEKVRTIKRSFKGATWSVTALQLHAYACV